MYVSPSRLTVGLCQAGNPDERTTLARPFHPIIDVPWKLAISLPVNGIELLGGLS
jgi:hypothetical protein